MKNIIDSLQLREAFSLSSPLPWVLGFILALALHTVFWLWNQKRKDREFDKKYRLPKRDE